MLGDGTAATVRSAALRSSILSCGNQRRAEGLRRSAPDSNELDAHPAHTEHDHRRNESGDDRAADHEPVGERRADGTRYCR
jgi:hypothetical protein